MIQRLFKRTLFFITAFLLVFVGLTASPAAANGIPVQIFLEHLPFKATWSPATAGRGVAVVSANDEQVRVMAQNLPTPPEGEVYYAWLEQVDGGFLAVGPLTYADDGTASIDQHMEALPHSEMFSWVIVSLEDPDNVGRAPATEVALAGKLPNALALPPTGNQVPALLPVTGGNIEPGGSIFTLPLLVAAALLGGILLYGGARRLRARVIVENKERKLL